MQSGLETRGDSSAYSDITPRGRKEEKKGLGRAWGTSVFC